VSVFTVLVPGGDVIDVYLPERMSAITLVVVTSVLVTVIVCTKDSFCIQMSCRNERNSDVFGSTVKVGTISTARMICVSSLAFCDTQAGLWMVDETQPHKVIMQNMNV
jgi:hypothetical protein